MLLEFDLLRTFNKGFFFCTDKKGLEEIQDVEKLVKQRTTTLQDKATSPRELKWKGKRRLRIIIILNSIGNQGRKQCLEVKLS